MQKGNVTQISYLLESGICNAGYRSRNTQKRRNTQKGFNAEQHSVTQIGNLLESGICNAG